ncbi:hypothetical protein [unidentified bacterial endosymbiont]|jgi:hypothetical protein|uniref:hypothetical protein n=1 Tax=unidentified bacterial endosymbiont TaxID=2355 RepID=UPI0020A1925E|nr:hypothetical protein [unidentified bacterial endosymbiont]
MSSEEQKIQCKKIEQYNSDILALQFKIEKISQILRGLDKSDLNITEKKKLRVRIAPKINESIANILNISFEECTKLPTDTLLKKLAEEQDNSKQIATEKLEFIATLSKSLLHLTSIRNKYREKEEQNDEGKNMNTSLK